MAIALEQEQPPVLQLTEHQQRRVWDGWFRSEVRAQYFAALAGRYDRYQTTVTWLTLISSSSAVVAILAGLPGKLSLAAPFLALLTSGISFYSLARQLEKKAAQARDLHTQWSKLADRYRDLWENMYDERATTRLAELDEKAIELGELGTFFPAKEKLIQKMHANVQRDLDFITGR